MPRRRDFLKFTVGAAGAAAVTPGRLNAETYKASDMLQYLCPPNNMPDQLAFTPSPPAEPFKAELFIPPVVAPKPVESLDPPYQPDAHQLSGETAWRRGEYERPEGWDLVPKDAYVLTQREFQWQYHPDAPYDAGTWGWGWEAPEGYTEHAAITPGPTVHNTYGRAVIVRQRNELPPVGNSKATFALPSTCIHLHNGHTASESDGNPQDWVDSGEFWDHHYGNFPSGGDPREKLSTLWYHDHRLDFTASNVYAGLSGFHLLFDEKDNNDETDPSGWQLPSGKYDIPLILHDVMFKADGQVAFSNFYTDGWLGDQVTINRRIRPRHTVEARKYRLRVLNGGPSRFYLFGFAVEGDSVYDNPKEIAILTGDGNFLPHPVWSKHFYMSVAQRYDIVIDFSGLEGKRVVLYNMAEQTNGKGPSGRKLKDPDGVLAFDVVAATGPDPSKIPDSFRELPPIPPKEEWSTLPTRVWDFDYDGGLWTINGLVMDPNRIDAGIIKNSTEVWVFRNTGNDWSHPVHCHFTEFLVLEVNGRPYELPGGQGFVVQESAADGSYRYSQSSSGTKDNPLEVFMGGPRRDVSTILPGDEMKVLIRFMDFEGRHVMHCHNVVHEDHAMMIRWDILPPKDPEGKAIKEPILTSVEAGEVWGDGFWGQSDPTKLDQKPFSFDHLESRPIAAKDFEPQRGRGNTPTQAPLADDSNGGE